MPEPKVTMTVRHPGSGVSVIDIDGELSGFAENALMEAYAQATDKGQTVIILNFGPLEYMNSSGIGLLVTVLVRANRQGQKLIAVGLSDHYKHIFELTRLNEAIQSYTTESDALNAMSPSK